MLIQKVRRTIETHNLISRGQHIVLGLSGGPDSVCLFHVLLRLSKELDLTLHPVHVNHRLRPGDAERDQRYVEELCRNNGLECRSFTVDCKALAEEQRMTSEEAGRKARYDAFCQVASEITAIGGQDAKMASCVSAVIAVAQNANDQAETVLFRLLRGTGIDGLAGIAYQRQERGFPVIRPLLDVGRSEIEAYCEKNRLEPVTDHTNHEAVYARNKIRLELIPLLEQEYNGNIQGGLARLARIAAADKAYLWQQAEREFGKSLLEEISDGGMLVMDRQSLAKLHKAIRHRVILRAFAQVGLHQDVSEERLEAADAIIEKKQAPKTVQFPHGHSLTVAGGKVKFV